MKNTELIAVLNDLIECCKDGEYGFTQCAHHAVAGELKSFFFRRAGDYRAAAQALQALVHTHGGRADTGGSLSGALHRGWVGVRSALLSQNEDPLILSESEQGEAQARARYAYALAQPLPEAVRLVVQRQYEALLQSNDDIAGLCARYRAPADS